MALSLLLDAAFIGTFGVAYVAVGSRMVRRRVAAAADKRALRMFVAWWWGVGGLFVMTGTSSALRAGGVDAIGIHLGIVILSMISLCVGLCGVLYYVTYLYWGSVRALVPYATYYSLIFSVLVYGVISEPTQAMAWVSSVSRLVILTGPFLTGAIVAFLLPVIVACALYGSLYFRLVDPVQKLRIGSTSTAFVLWFGSAILASAVGFADAAAWTAFGRGIGLVATALLLVGYWPPRSVRERAARAEREATRRELSRDVALPTESALGGRHREPMLDRTRRRGSPAG